MEALTNYCRHMEFVDIKDVKAVAKRFTRKYDGVLHIIKDSRKRMPEFESKQHFQYFKTLNCDTDEEGA